MKFLTTDSRTPSYEEKLSAALIEPYESLLVENYSREYADCVEEVIAALYSLNDGLLQKIDELSVQGSPEAIPNLDEVITPFTHWMTLCVAKAELSLGNAIHRHSFERKRV